MTVALDHHIPALSIVARLENHAVEMRKEISITPWWRWRRRLMLEGALATYNYEARQILGMAGGWQPIWKDIRRR